MAAITYIPGGPNDKAATARILREVGTAQEELSTLLTRVPAGNSRNALLEAQILLLATIDKLGEAL